LLNQKKLGIAYRNAAGALCVATLMLEWTVMLERQYGYLIDEINAAWRGTVTLPSLSVGFEIIL
jgi:hypothetical protein